MRACDLHLAPFLLSCVGEEVLYALELGHSLTGPGVASQKVHFRVRHFAGVFALP